MGASQQAVVASYAQPEAAIPEWSASRKTAGVILTSSNRVATVTSSALEEARSDGARNSGKRYFELEATNAAAFGGASIALGLKLASAAVDGSIVATGTYTYRCNGQVRNAGTLIATTTTYTSNSTIGIAVDIDAGKLWFYFGAWILSGDPASGANPAITFPPGSSIEALVWTDNVAGTKAATSRFLAAQMINSPPSGFSAGF